MAIGQWRDHFPNTGTIDVAYGNGRIYCANSYMVYAYNLADNSIEKYTKANQLSDVGITAIAFDQTTNTLVVGYDNGNLDLLSVSGTTNIKSIQNSSIFGLKTINDIRVKSGRCYLSCGFGIVYFNLAEQEVIDTYIIGPGGANVQVNETVEFNGKMYAATDIGLMRADADSPFLANFANWSLVSSLPNPDRQVLYAEVLDGRLYLVQTPGGTADDSLWRTTDGATWELQWSDGEIYGLEADGGQLFVFIFNYVDVYNADTSFGAYVGFDDGSMRPHGVVAIESDEFWVGDEKLGLMRYDANAGLLEQVQPTGPKSLDAYSLKVEGEDLFKTSGSPASNWSRTFNNNGFELFSEGDWTTYALNTDPVFSEQNIRDVMTVAVDPDDPTHWFVGTWGDGILEYRNGAFSALYDHQNTPLQPSESLGDGPGVAGLAFDAEGNLWVTNGYSTTPLLVYTADGEWKAFSTTAAGAGGSDLYSEILIDQSGYKWCIRPRGHGLVVYNDNGSVSDDSDDEAVAITSDIGQGNLPTMDIYSIAEDLNGEIWVGTGEGVAVFYSAGSVFTDNNFDAQQILIEQDGNIQVLLETEQVRGLAVDGANRKWIGTANSGVFLMSEDGTEEVNHFTVENSPLPSNTVNAVAIDGVTGEVYFATDMGVVSYKSSATEGAASNECALVYPNPVRPDYEGPIAITGLERNTNVKITDVGGNLVFETTSEGGQAIWDGRNFSGQKVTTGVYTALCTAPEGNSKCVSKIMVIR